MQDTQSEISLKNILDSMEGVLLSNKITKAYAELMKSDKLPAIAPATRFPLIICSHVTYTERLGVGEENPYYKKVAALAYRWGISPEAMPAYVINLTDEKYLPWLASGKWQGLWNGVWIIYCQTSGHNIKVDTDEYDFNAKPTNYDGAGFLKEFGEPIVRNQKFRFGLVLGDWAASSYAKPTSKNDTRNFVKELSYHAAKDYISQSIFIGCNKKVEVICDCDNVGFALAEGDRCV